MCVPVAAVLGSLVSAASAFTGARAQSSQLRAQAKFAERQAELARETGAVEADRQRRAGERAFGSQIANFAKGGILLEGSPASVLSNIRTESELDTDRIRLSARAREDEQRFRSSLNRSRARAADIQGAFQTVSPIISLLK